MVVWLTAEIVALFILFGLWIVSGFGGRLHTEPHQSRHYAVVRWFLDALYRGAERTYGLRIEIEEPELTAAELAARLARPVIVLSRHAGPGDSFLLVQQLLSVYGRRPRVVMKASLQFDPILDVLGNRLPNVFVQHRASGEKIFIDQIERMARGLDTDGALVIFPGGPTGRPAGGAAASGGWSWPTAATWPTAPARCPTCSRPGRAGPSPPSARGPTPT